MQGLTGYIGWDVFQHTGAVKGVLVPVNKSSLWILISWVLECENGLLIKVTDSNLRAPPALVTKGEKESINVDVLVNKGDHGGATPSKTGTVKGVSQGVTRDVKGQRSAPAGPCTWNRGRAPLQESVNVDRLLIPPTVNCFSAGLVLEGDGVHAPGQRCEEELIGLKQAT